MDTGSPPALTGAPVPSRRSAGFSLVEVVLAIGIIAFAFVALIGLLPTGLAVFRSSIDAANEMWIMQNLNSMVQVTPWDEVRKLGYDKSQTIFYFDEEGRQIGLPVSSDLPDKSTPPEKAKRLYAVKLVVEELTRPGATSSAEVIQGTYRVVAVFAPYVKPKAMQDFDKISTPEDLDNVIKRGSELKTRAFLVARMDAEKDSAPTGP